MKLKGELKMYRVIKDTYDQITMRAKAYSPEGKLVDVHATWVWAPRLTFYDDTNKEWINNWQWLF